MLFLYSEKFICKRTHCRSTFTSLNRFFKEWYWCTLVFNRQNTKLDTDNNLLFKNNNGIQNLLLLY